MHCLLVNADLGTDTVPHPLGGVQRVLPETGVDSSWWRQADDEMRKAPPKRGFSAAGL